MDAKMRRRHPYWVGVFSVLDISGDSEPFARLARRSRSNRRSPWEEIGRDFEAVGEHLTNALAGHFKTLPPERQIELARALLERARERASDTSTDQDRLAAQDSLRRIRAYLSYSKNLDRRDEQEEEVSAGA